MPRLADIAYDMNRQARRNGIAIRNLPRGLRLELVWAGGMKVLTLSRPVKMPDDDEIALCLEAFGVQAVRHAETAQTKVTYRWPSGQ